MDRILQTEKRLCQYFLMVFCLLLFSLMAGCATTSKSLAPEATSKIKRLGIVTVLKDKELRIFDHTDTSQKTYGGVMFGAIGGLIEGVAIAVETNIRIKSSLGGDPDLLRKQLREYSLNKAFLENVSDRLSEKYRIVSADPFVSELRQTKGEKLKIEDYLDACKKCEADTMLKIEYFYGLAAYAREKASAAILARFSVYEVGTKALIMEKEIVSDIYFKKSRVVPDFAANDSELYKKDLSEAVDALSAAVARDFGLDLPANARIKRAFAEYPGKISALSMTCNKPYKLGQDCTIWSGAKRTIWIEEQEMKIAGSDDGKIVLVMHDRLVDEASVLACFNLVRDELLEKAGIHIMNVVKVVNKGKIKGFVLELDGDGYSFLRNYTV